MPDLRNGIALISPPLLISLIVCLFSKVIVYNWGLSVILKHIMAKWKRLYTDGGLSVKLFVHLNDNQFHYQVRSV